jgi:hypothetical protein
MVPAVAQGVQRLKAEPRQTHPAQTEPLTVAYGPAGDGANDVDLNINLPAMHDESSLLGTVRSSADEVGGQQGSDLERGMQIGAMCQNIRSRDLDDPSWPSARMSWADISPGWDALG